MKEQSYYYRLLSRDERHAYYDILNGLQSMQHAFPVLRFPMQKLSELFFLVRMDHPEIFYASGFRCRAYADATKVEFIPDYLFELKKIRDHRQALSSRVAKLVRQAREWKESEREQFVHDLICTTVTYDKLKKPYSHEIIGSLGQGVAVCEGIAKAVKILCDELEIPCIIAMSEAAPDRGIKYRHMWNLLQSDGKWYHLDATFDNTLTHGGEIRYDYFNLSDEQIFKDHEPSMFPLPACTDNTGNWYRMRKLSFTKPEEVEKRMLQAARRGRCFTFQWRGSYFTRHALEQLLTIAENASLQFERHAAISVNASQAVVRVTFSSDQHSTLTEDRPKISTEE